MYKNDVVFFRWTPFKSIVFPFNTSVMEQVRFIDCTLGQSTRL
jgi:hypothetical protein